MNQIHQSFESEMMFRFPGVIRCVRRCFKVLEAQETLRFCAPLSNHMRSRRVVRNAVYPRPQRTTVFESVEASPQREMDFLQQVAPLLRICLVCVGQPRQRCVICLRCLFIKFVLTHKVR